jgi:hypothetical protein
LGSVCRRIYRIFSHAYFHHRHIYDQFEKETSLCKRFTKFVIKYELMTADSLIVPMEEPAAEASESPSPSSSSSTSPLSSTSSFSSAAEAQSSLLDKEMDVTGQQEKPTTTITNATPTTTTPEKSATSGESDA